jgi:hypothetical protein
MARHRVSEVPPPTRSQSPMVGTMRLLRSLLHQGLRCASDGVCDLTNASQQERLDYCASPNLPNFPILPGFQSAG